MNGNNTSATLKSPATTSNDDRVVESSIQGIIGMTGAIQTDEGASKAFLNVVPVRVCVGETFVDTLAFLDQGSTTTLCDERLGYLISLELLKKGLGIALLLSTRQRNVVVGERRSYQYPLFRAERKYSSLMFTVFQVHQFSLILL